MAKSHVLKTKGGEVSVSNVDKVMFPATGFTKGEVINYYIQIHETLLPHLKNRPVTMLRMPNGVTGKSFYEKEAPSHTPDFVKRVSVQSKSHGVIHYILINDLRSLVWAANLANLEMHCFLASAPKTKKPDSVVFDLDPGVGKDILDCGALALEMQVLLKRLKLESFAKTSGSKGMQLYVPLNTPATFEATALFAKNFAEYLEGQYPDLVVSKMGKDLRNNKILIDWSQNSSAKTTACVYSLRAKQDKPFVSMPIGWDELRKIVKLGKAKELYFSPDEAIKRVQKIGDLFAPLLKLKQKLPKGFYSAEASTKANSSKQSSELSEYNRKRDFKKTSEPGPKVRTSKTKNLFVIQKHEASHLHYDFRLEMDGVLKSWAVPKGVPTEDQERRLAMAVEDHPVNYARFEGIISKGNYGGGTVMVWDIGTFTTETEDPIGDLEKGKIDILLKGTKLSGKWILIRDRRDPRRWILLKGKSGEVICGKRQFDKSSLTKRTMQQIAKEKDSVWKTKGRSLSKGKTEPIQGKASKNRHADEESSTEDNVSEAVSKNIRGHGSEKVSFIEPMKARIGTDVPKGKDWIFEVKFDGYRALILKDGTNCKILSRNNNDFSKRFSELLPAIKALPVKKAIIDGEVLAVDNSGRSTFQGLQNYPSDKEKLSIEFYAFDVLHLEGIDLTDQPLEKRKALLEKLLDGSDLKYSKGFTGKYENLLAGVKKAGFEGLVAKRLDSQYEPGDRSKDWLKFKVINQQEFVIGGYARKTTSTFASLLVGYYEGSDFIYAGKLTGGFIPSVRRDLLKLFKGTEIASCPFANLPDKKLNKWGGGLTKKEMLECTWIKPQFVCMAKYAEWTDNERLRHGSFVALRDDKKPNQVGREA